MTQEPVMVLPNGDILRKGDYAQLYNGKIVGPVKYRPEEKDDTEAPWRLARIWYTPDGLFYPWGSDSGQDILAKAVCSKNGEKPMTKTYQEAMEELNVAAYAALRAAWNEDGAPVDALREVAAEIDRLIDHGVTRAEMRDMLALYKGAKLAGLV